MNAPAVATARPSRLIGVTWTPPWAQLRMPQPITVPPIPMASVAMAPPGSRPGMIALARSPTTVPNPIHTSTVFAHAWACSIKAVVSIASCLPRGNLAQ